MDGTTQKFDNSMLLVRLVLEHLEKIDQSGSLDEPKSLIETIRSLYALKWNESLNVYRPREVLWLAYNDNIQFLLRNSYTCIIFYRRK